MMAMLSRDAPHINAAAAMLAGCGPQPPIGAPGTVPQSHAIATQADQADLSWLL
jgi:hypothetical protein